jgi:hypothetical protein
VPKATNAPQQNVSLFDHLVGAADQRQRDSEAERLGSLEVENHLDFRGLHDRQVSRLLALENPAGVDADLTERIRNTASVAHQAAGGGELAILGDRGHRVADSQCSKLFALIVEECIRTDHEPAGSQLGQGCEDCIEFALAAYAQFIGRNYEEAMRLAREGIRQRGDFVGAHRVLTAAAGMAGQNEVAKAALLELLRAQSNISLAWIAKQMPIKEDADREHYLEGFRRAGLG